ncbi:MAG TPA: hypothetical protein VIV56_14830, partial [Gemmatimonadales bacterium]
APGPQRYGDGFALALVPPIDGESERVAVPRGAAFELTDRQRCFQAVGLENGLPGILGHKKTLRV